METKTVTQLAEKQAAIVPLIVKQAAEHMPINLVFGMTYIGMIPAEDEKGNIGIAEHLRMVRGQMIIVIEEMYIKKELITNADAPALLALSIPRRLND